MSEQPNEQLGIRHYFQVNESSRDPIDLVRLWVTPVRIYLIRVARSGKLVQVTEFRNEAAWAPEAFIQEVMEAIPGNHQSARKRELILTETPLAILPEAWVEELTPAEMAKIVISQQATAGNVMFFPEPDTDWGALIIQTRNWTEVLNSYWPDFTIRHAAGLVWESMNEIVSQDERVLWVQVLEERTLLIGAKEGGTLRLLNAYHCRDEADRPYYLQAVREVLGWKEDEVSAICAGELGQAPPPGWLHWEGLKPAAPRSLLRPWPNSLAHTPWWRFICLLTNSK